jgi:protein-S-isoprenylcysteine O-methyltransferase Ste14
VRPRRPAARPAGARRRSLPAALLLSLLVSALDAALLALALGGLGPLLSHPRALALVGCWTAAGLALALVRPARSREVAASTREPRVVLLLLGLLPFLTPPLAALGERIGAWPLPGGAALGWAGVALVAAGLGIRVAAMAQLGPRFSPLVAVQREHALETGGLYARVRHPGYLGAALATLGAVAAFGSGLGLLPLLPFLVLLGARARREEALLERHFGEAWRAYRARSGAFLPRF